MTDEKKIPTHLYQDSAGATFGVFYLEGAKKGEATVNILDRRLPNGDIVDLPDNAEEERQWIVPTNRLREIVVKVPGAVGSPLNSGMLKEAADTNERYLVSMRHEQAALEGLESANLDLENATLIRKKVYGQLQEVTRSLYEEMGATPPAWTSEAQS